MLILPGALEAWLRRGPRVIVAPVGVGFGQDALQSWALQRGYSLAEHPAQLAQGAWLWLPRRRSHLQALPMHVPHQDVLVVDEALARLDFQAWADALPQAGPEWRRASHRQADGWPAALPLAAQLAPFPPEELPRHPLIRAYLGALVPEESREWLRAAAAAPVLTPQVCGVLGLPPEQLVELYDAGWLFDVPGGLALPALLRRSLRGALDAGQALRAANALREAGLESAGLEALADAGLWEPYLERLASHAKTGMGEEALREKLRLLPGAWRETPAAQYLAGLLARMLGDLQHAELQYRAALLTAQPPLAPVIHNAHGVILAMQHRPEEALRSFEAATSGPRRTAGEAWHNRAGLLTQLGRHAEAEGSLREAVAAFRAAGDEAREAQSLELLGTLYTERGLLHEAVRAYQDAVRLLEHTSGGVDAFAFLNLAEVHALLGNPDLADGYLRAAQERHPDGRAQGWLARGRALLELQRGHVEGAQSTLEALIASRPSDQQLRAEAAWLLARTLRLRGDHEAARALLPAAAPLGLRTLLERALLGQGSLDEVIARARTEEARYELASALLARGEGNDVREVLDLVRAHGYAALLQGPDAVKLAAQALEDAEARALFPLHLSVLGALRVRFAGRTLSLPDFPTRKSAALLVALAFSARPASREELAEAFWPGAKNPLGSLQTAVYHLRGALGVPVVRSERGLLSLAFPVQTDLAALEQAHRAALSGEGEATLGEALKGAGPFLPEFPDDFEEERASAQVLVQGARRELLRLLAPGSPGRDEVLRSLLHDDPYDEEARAQLISWLESQGDHEAARQERQRWQELLRELG